MRKAHSEIVEVCLRSGFYFCKFCPWKSNVSPLLVHLVVKETVRTVLSADLSCFVEQNHHEDDDEVEPCVEYNANGLARFVFSTVNEICAKWKENFPIFKLPKRIPKYSLQAIRNNRRKMEDRHVVIEDMHTLLGERLQLDQPYSFFGVYDGHGGVDASYYAAAHLHYLAVQDPAFTESPTRAMMCAFNQIDESFIKKAKREGLRSGTTGVTAVVNSDCIHIAWLGDSQAVLMRNGQAITIMEPHSPEREDEKRRIEEMGGCVVWFGAWRVNGSLSVSRSIGDPEYKPYVCSDADTAVIPLDGTEECIILACDGLWDGVTKEQACQTVQENIDSGADLSQVSSILVTQAKDNGSGDNITAIVVYLNPYHRRNTHLNAKEKAETDTVEQAGNSGQSVADGKSNGGVTNTEEESRGDNSGKASNERGSGEEIKDVLNSNNNNCSVEEKENDFHFRSNISVENKSRFTGKNTVYTQGQRKADKSGQSAPVNDIKHFTSVEADGDLEASRARIRREGVHRGLRRSSSEPPSLYQKMKDTKADGIYPLLEIVSRSKKTNHKALPMKHNSMPATLKPKSTTSNKSLSGTHDAGVSNIFKTKDRQLRRTFPRGTRD
ncbi:protein phosphatase 1F-like isoform X2 [Apostichopus japonicus]|uniref:protein phosphatase 1F-like isoform X2 n=1 Tax=Stichopus japonicus TaxID=307972 RepID=UPI003AB21078